MYWRGLILKVLYNSGIALDKSVDPKELAQTLKMIQPNVFDIPLARVGPEGDGGYWIPQDLSGIEHVFSPGVGGQWGFELALAENNLMQIHLCDEAKLWPECPFSIDDFWLSAHTGSDGVSLQDWVHQHVGGKSGDLLLQMDIEGAEYGVLLACPTETLQRFRVVVVEFHFMDRIHNRLAHDSIFRPVLAYMDSMFDIIHVNVNPVSSADSRSGELVFQTIEVTYLRKM